MTQALSVRCQNCGSSLQVGDSLRFITCGYCHSELQVVRDAATIHTEVLQHIEKNMVTTVNHLKVIEIQNEIERLDREWEMWKSANLSRNKDGSIDEPWSPASNKMIAILVLGSVGMGALVLALNRADLGAWGLLAVAGLILAAVAIYRNNVAKDYERACLKYERQRANYLSELGTARSVSNCGA